ncbi:MAG: hypothetical protein ACYTBS_04620, partial [Planctomycetota bacterium]
MNLQPFQQIRIVTYKIETMPVLDKTNIKMAPDRCHNGLDRIGIGTPGLSEVALGVTVGINLDAEAVLQNIPGRFVVRVYPVTVFTVTLLAILAVKPLAVYKECPF